MKKFNQIFVYGNERGLLGSWYVIEIPNSGDTVQYLSKSEYKRILKFTQTSFNNQRVKLDVDAMNNYQKMKYEKLGLTPRDPIPECYIVKERW